MTTIHNDPQTFNQPIVFGAEVTFADTPAEISLSNLTSLTGTGTATFADLAATDDLTVGDDASITGDLTVGGAATVAGALQGADLIATDDLTVGDDASIGGDLAVTGSVTATGLDLSFAAIADIDLPGGAHLVRSWSATVDTSSFTTGATATINLASPPTAMIPIGVRVTTASGDTVASSNGSTTGLAVEIGIGSDADFYMASVSIFGTAGAKEGAPGVGLGGYRAADTIQAKFTATGGAPNVAHIIGMELSVTVYYMGVA